MAEEKDYICPICMYILIEPVTLPCKHSLCMLCYKQIIEKANLYCPICRLRISVWARKAAKGNCLIDKVKWDVIKNAFPEQVQKRLEGKDTLDDSMEDTFDYETELRRLKELSKPGEIRQEYEAALLKLHQQREEQVEEEEEASAALIKTLQQEEENEMEKFDKQMNELSKMDREMAAQLQESFLSDVDKLAESDTWNSSTMTHLGIKTESKPDIGGAKKRKTKQLKQPVKNSLTMMTFFSPIPHIHGAASSNSDGTCKGGRITRDVDAASTHFDLSSQTYPPGKVSQKFNPQSPTLQSCSYSSGSIEVPVWKKHSVSVSSDKGWDQAAASSQPASHAADIGIVGQSIAKPVIDPLFADLEADGQSASRELYLSSCDSDLTDTRFKYMVTSNLDSLHVFNLDGGSEITDLRDPSFTIYDHHLPGHNIEDSHIGTVFDEACRESDKPNKSSQDTHQTLLEDVTLNSQLTSSNAKEKVTFGKSCEGQIENIDESFKQFLSVAQTDTSSAYHTEMDKCSEKSKYISLNSDDNEQKENNNRTTGMTVCDIDIFNSIKSYNTDTEVPIAYHNDTDRNRVDGENSISEAGDRRNKIHFKVFQNHKETCKKQSKKENKVKMDHVQQKSIFNITAEHCAVNPSRRVVKCRRINQLTKNTKNATILSAEGKIAESNVSIRKWCMGNSGKGEPDGGWYLGPDAVIDETELGCSKGDNTLDYFRTRKHNSTSDDEIEEKMVDKEQITNVFGGQTKDLAGNQRNMECLRKTVTSVENIDNSVNVDSDSLDVLCPDGVGQSKVSQEEQDRLMAVRLQEMYAKLDKKSIQVDRFKGCKDQYPLRKRPKMK